MARCPRWRSPGCRPLLRRPPACRDRRARPSSIWLGPLGSSADHCTSTRTSFACSARACAISRSANASEQSAADPCDVHASQGRGGGGSRACRRASAARGRERSCGVQTRRSRNAQPYKCGGEEFAEASSHAEACSHAEVSIHAEACSHAEVSIHAEACSHAEVSIHAEACSHAEVSIHAEASSHVTLASCHPHTIAACARSAAGRLRFGGSTSIGDGQEPRVMVWSGWGFATK